MPRPRRRDAARGRRPERRGRVQARRHGRGCVPAVPHLGEAAPAGPGVRLLTAGGSMAVARAGPKALMNDTDHAGLAAGLPTDFARSAAAVVVMHADGTLLYVSEAFCELVGSTRAELRGRRGDDAEIASSAERTRWIIERASEVGAAFTYRRLYT